MFYHIITYGCQMNVHESEKLAGILENLGYTHTSEKENADIIIFNTCCIRDTAERRALNNIAALKKLKNKNPDMIIGVCGCMPQQDSAKQYIEAKMPHVDIVFGTHNIHNLARLLENCLKEKKRIVEIWGESYELQPANTPITRTSGVNAWVNITYGCNNFCTYCVVPYVRGRERSRPMPEIIGEVKKLINEGKYSEITLLGQNVNSYGNDLYDGSSFAKLLSEVTQLDGDFRLKFLTSHPKDFKDEVIDIIAQYDKISKSIHLPVQSGSNAILKAMNRKYTREYYLDRIDYLRKKIPNVGISSDVIVGFPGETEQDFEDTLDLVKQVRYNNLYMFMYSPRKNTPAANMPNQIAQSVKKERIKKLIELQREIMREIAKDCVGKRYKALIEEYKDGVLSAITDCGKLVFIENDNQSLVGKFCQVLITRAKSGRLVGELV
ncbi:MAG: tRNA (N6-isopentenyl adenosine(37)-C2)-methylthiotransferase MiaB [Clostridiales bacterium]|nr:tRNA (N6-isopentenyl adenosine(37)-C2)-methylthiotransferase MiaB [Clostridiales bacterium]